MAEYYATYAPDGARPAYHGPTTSFHLTIEKNGVITHDTTFRADSKYSASESARKLIDTLTPYVRTNTLPASDSDASSSAIAGEVRLTCPDCRKTFHVYLRERCSAYSCRCGHLFDLTKGLRTYRYTCTKCGHIHNGHTNFTGETMHELCQCRTPVELVYDQAAEKYAVPASAAPADGGAK